MLTCLLVGSPHLLLVADKKTGTFGILRYSLMQQIHTFQPYSPDLSQNFSDIMSESTKLNIIISSVLIDPAMIHTAHIIIIVKMLKWKVNYTL